VNDCPIVAIRSANERSFAERMATIIHPNRRYHDSTLFGYVSLFLPVAVDWNRLMDGLFSAIWVDSTLPEQVAESFGRTRGGSTTGRDALGW